MSDVLGRSIESKARKILKFEQALVAMTAIFAMITLGVSIYFEKTYGVKAYSFAIALLTFSVSFGCFWALFTFFRSGFQYRSPGRGAARLALWIASLYIVAAATVAYIVAFSMMGISAPWAGEGRENLYACYFLLAVATIFLSRSVAFYMKLRAYVLRSLGEMSR